MVLDQVFSRASLVWGSPETELPLTLLGDFLRNLDLRSIIGTSSQNKVPESIGKLFRPTKNFTLNIWTLLDILNSIFGVFAIQRSFLEDVSKRIVRSVDGGVWQTFNQVTLIPWHLSTQTKRSGASILMKPFNCVKQVLSDFISKSFYLGYSLTSFGFPIFFTVIQIPKRKL